MIGEIPNTPGVHGVAIASKLGRGFTSNGGDSTVTSFELKTLKQRTRINVGKRPDGILYDTESGQVFTFNALSADATVIHPGTEKVIGTIPLGGKPESAVADGKGHIYVNIEDKSELLELDTRKLSVLHRWPLAPGVEPAGLAIDLVRRRLFCTCRNQKMVVLNADNGQVLATLPIGQHTDACVFDPETQLVFSSNGDGTLDRRALRCPGSLHRGGNDLDANRRPHDGPRSDDAQSVSRHGAGPARRKAQFRAGIVRDYRGRQAERTAEARWIAAAASGCKIGRSSKYLIVPLAGNAVK